MARACLKKAFRELRVSVCGRFYPNEGGVAGYGNRMRVKYTAVLVEQTTGSNRAQTRAVSQRGRRENLTQHSYSISSFKAKAHQALPRKP